MLSMLAWLKSQPEQPAKPFFVWLHFYDAPQPYVPPPAEFQRQYPGDTYDAKIAYMDQQIGRFVEAVKKRSPTHNTQSRRQGNRLSAGAVAAPGNSLLRQLNAHKWLPRQPYPEVGPSIRALFSSPKARPHYFRMRPLSYSDLVLSNSFSARA
jgi:hypothetical protein